MFRNKSSISMVSNSMLIEATAESGVRVLSYSCWCHEVLTIITKEILSNMGNA
jgi:uncharacterized protein YycO